MATSSDSSVRLSPGILLINLGTPDKPNAFAVRRYLKEFLSDPRVVEIPRVIWWFILNGYVLNTRPFQSAKKYKKIWTEEGSPLKIHTELQTKMLKGFMGERLKPKTKLQIEYAMRYGSPSIRETINNMIANGCDRLALIPLYPQYAGSTTGSIYDLAFSLFKKVRNPPAFRLVKGFHDHPKYIAALAKNINEYWERTGRPDMLVMSFHGVPRYTIDKGDPYYDQCKKTAALLAKELGLGSESCMLAFQSRFGRAKWLKPYTSRVLKELGKMGKARVDVVCPGFVSDCLETLEEIAIEGKEIFLKAGGKEFHYIPCLNERNDWLYALTDIALDNLAGWVTLR